MMLVFKLRANLLILPIIYTYLRNRILLSLRQQLIVEVFFFRRKTYVIYYPNDTPLKQ